MANQTLPDFQKLVVDYHRKLTNGQRADLRKADEPDALLDIPAFYYLLQSTGLKPGLQAGRLIYFLPYVGHKEGTGSMGSQMQKQDISEKRLVQVVRADSPDDLVYLRRLAIQMKATVDWEDFGKMLFYWGKNAKRQLLQDYYLRTQKETNQQTS